MRAPAGVLASTRGATPERARGRRLGIGLLRCQSVACQSPPSGVPESPPHPASTRAPTIAIVLMSSSPAQQGLLES